MRVYVAISVVLKERSILMNACSLLFSYLFLSLRIKYKGGIAGYFSVCLLKSEVSDGKTSCTGRVKQLLYTEDVEKIYT